MSETRENIDFIVLGAAHPSKHGGLSYHCKIGSTECYLDTTQTLTKGTWHAERITNLSRRGDKGNIYGKLVGQITPAGMTPPNRGPNQSTPQPGHSLLAYEKLADRIGRFILRGEVETSMEFKARVFQAMWGSMANDHGVMAEMEAQAGAPANPSTEPETGGGLGDELPPDDDIPF